MEKGSPNYKLRFLAAHNHWKLGNFRNAIIHLKRCNVIKKEISDPLIDLSLMMLDFKRYGDARFFAKKALKIEENPAAYFVLGKSAMKYRNYFKAKGYFEKSISLDPEYGISYNALGITLMRLKKYSEANTAFSAAMATMVSSAEVMNNIGFSLEKKGNNDEALVYYSKAVSKNPENKVMQKNIKRIKEKIKEVK